MTPTTPPEQPKESSLEYLEEHLTGKEGLHLIVKDQEKWIRLTDITDILSEYDTRSRPATAPTRECIGRFDECKTWEEKDCDCVAGCILAANNARIAHAAIRNATLDEEQSKFVSGMKSNGMGAIYTRPDEPSFIVGVIIGKRYYQLKASVLGNISAKEIPMPEYYKIEPLRQQSTEAHHEG